MSSVGVGVTFDHQIEGSDDHEHGLDEVLNNGTLPVNKFREIDLFNQGPLLTCPYHSGCSSSDGEKGGDEKKHADGDIQVKVEREFDEQGSAEQIGLEDDWQRNLKVQS